MKKIVTLLFFLSLISSNICFSQSYNWKSLSARRNLVSILFISSTEGWIYGGDIVYKTTDGGVTWSYPLKLNYKIGGTTYYSGHRSPRLMYFNDSLKGWAAQYTNILLKTINGGNSWATVNTGINYIELYAVQFVNNLTGWAAGRDPSNYPSGLIIKTTNGGINWAKQPTNFNYEIMSISMLNPDTGFFAGWFSDTIGYTYNGGVSWNKLRIGTGQGIKRLIFPNPINGWALGNPGYVSQTSNSGINWNIYTNTFGNTSNIFFLNTSTGWITGVSGYIGKTTNSGLNFVVQRVTPSGGYLNEANAYDVFFKNANTGWVTLGDGTILKTTNSGTNWDNEIFSPYGKILAIKFFTDFNGCAISNYINGQAEHRGYFWKTSNCGANWENVFTTPENDTLGSMYFINEITGFVAANSKVYKTTNAGLNWNLIITVGSVYNSMFFVNEQTGWICGYKGEILKTTSQGLSWIIQESGSTKNLNSIFFCGPDTGYIAADSGLVFISWNGGLNWTQTTPYNFRHYKEITFVNNSTGFLLGSCVQGFPPYNSRSLLKTTDKGITWTVKFESTIFGNSYSFNDVFFSNINTGWIVAEDSTVLKTTDSGESWFTEPTPIKGSFNCIFFVNENIGWIGGTHGEILTTSPLIGITSIGNEIPQSFSLSQNYPNPFNPVTRIKFSLPAPSKGGAWNVRLVIYDILGREVATLIPPLGGGQEGLKPGSYEVTWDGSRYASGVYFYRLITESFTETKRMVLIK